LKYRDSLQEVVEKNDPRMALIKLSQDLKSVKVVQENCHSLTHEIGYLAIKKYKDFGKSVSYNYDICGGGYLHGITEHYLEDTPDAKNKVYEICTDPADGGCFHAIGHGFMLLNDYDVDKSVTDCKTLKTPKQITRCGEGIFMENFDSNNTPDDQKPFLKAADPFYPCLKYDAPFQDTCYYYSGRYIYKTIGEPLKALQKCNKIKTIFAQTCVRGMSAAILRSNLEEPANIENICNSVPDKIKSCLLGAVNYHLFIIKDSSKTQNDMCNSFKIPKNIEICTEQVKQSKILESD